MVGVVPLAQAVYCSNPDAVDHCWKLCPAADTVSIGVRLGAYLQALAFFCLVLVAPDEGGAESVWLGLSVSFCFVATNYIMLYLHAITMHHTIVVVLLSHIPFLAILSGLNSLTSYEVLGPAGVRFLQSGLILKAIATAVLWALCLFGWAYGQLPEWLHLQFRQANCLAETNVVVWFVPVSRAKGLGPGSVALVATYSAFWFVVLVAGSYWSLIAPTVLVKRGGHLRDPKKKKIKGFPKIGRLRSEREANREKRRESGGDPADYTPESEEGDELLQLVMRSVPKGRARSGGGAGSTRDVPAASRVPLPTSSVSSSPSTSNASLPSYTTTPRQITSTSAGSAGSAESTRRGHGSIEADGAATPSGMLPSASEGMTALSTWSKGVRGTPQEARMRWKQRQVESTRHFIIWPLCAVLLTFAIVTIELQMAMNDVFKGEMALDFPGVLSFFLALPTAWAVAKALRRIQEGRRPTPMERRDETFFELAHANRHRHRQSKDERARRRRRRMSRLDHQGHPSSDRYAASPGAQPSPVHHHHQADHLASSGPPQHPLHLPSNSAARRSLDSPLSPFPPDQQPPFQAYAYLGAPSSHSASAALPVPPPVDGPLAHALAFGDPMSPYDHSALSGELSPMTTTMFGGALATPNLSSSHPADGAGSTPGASPSAQPASKVVQKADRSCKKCRERRVRCDRAYPSCARCKKRREDCSYGTGVFVETVEEGSDQAKIAELEAKVATLETQLKQAQTSQTRSNGPLSGLSSTFQPAVPINPLTVAALANENLAGVISHAVTSGLSSDELAALDGLLRDQEQAPMFGMQERSGFGGPRKDVAITCFLLDASTRACCTKLPGLHLLRDRLPYFKANLHALEPPHRLAVVCLCAIGVRVTPNSSLFGVRSVTKPDGSPAPSSFLAVGARREHVGKALAAVAIEACWATGILKHRSYDNLDALVGLVQYLIHEEGRADDARLFVREMVGMFLDIRHEEMSSNAPTRLNETNTTAVFLADAFVSSSCHKPSFITPLDLQDYFVSSGLQVPDLVNMQLGDMIEAQLGSPLSRSAILGMLTSLNLYVFSCHRVFAQVANPRRPNGASILPFLRNLWSVLDQIHNAVQRLQQHLVNLSSAPPGYDDDPHAIDHAILLAVRADNSLVDLIMLMHVHLTEKYSGSAFWPESDGDDELERMRAESSMRVFKCLKLLAFYCQLYLASQDKHNVFHLLLRLEALGDWTSLVSLRIGSQNGPATEEFEATQEELDWFRSGLELACYYSPRAAVQLQKLNNARQHVGPAPYRPPSPSRVVDSSGPPTGSTAASTSFSTQSPPHQHQHYDTPSTSMTMYTPASSFCQNPSAPPQSSTALSTDHRTQSDRSPHLRQDSLQSIHSVIAQDPATAQQHNPHQKQQQQPRHASHAQASTSTDPSASTSITVGPEFDMSQFDPTPHGSTTTAAPSPAFADGAAHDLEGTNGDFRSAFRSLDWVDLSLTPAIGAAGAGSDGSSVEGGDLWKAATKGRPPA
ncbi:hypothetical protein JCM10212_005636 [Sporobolomyces blumeae]